jgi:hypothetical protein
MNLLPLRLKPGDDLRRVLELAVARKEIDCAFVISGIGSLLDARLRLAGRDETTLFQGPSEILTLAGSLAENGAHLHMSISTQTGQVFGGHVVHGNRVRTTAEVLLALLPEWQFRREQDEATGYPELATQRREPP